MNRTSACVLCGHDDAFGVRMSLVEWREPIGKEIWSHIPRCRDAVACRARVENVNGEPWPLDDSTPATPRPAPIPDPPAADVDEEVPAWLRA